ncbi:MAG: NAD-dependent deacetylase [Bacteroidetes bacterium]|nr:MAG: NAD-dependent deacetylase [Bacteroidota bacterium]
MKYLETIKEWLEKADSVVINTGAGMGVDSGLADYRGNGGQWGQVESQTNASVFEIVNPQALLENPAYGWKLFGTRIKEYATIDPHQGFYILKKWISDYELDHFVLTSNIDSHFQKAGFEEQRIRELHGSLAYFQSSRPDLCQEIWKNEQNYQEILTNAEEGIFPICPFSKVMARPNVYMFRDDTYISTRSKAQDANFQNFLAKNKGKNMLVFEIGSGSHVQSIRVKTRMLRTEFGAKIVRINPKDFKVHEPNIGIAKGALAALTEIEQYLKK